MALTGSNLDVLWYRDMVLVIYRWPTPEKVGLWDLLPYQGGQICCTFDGRFEQFDIISDARLGDHS